MTVLKLFTILLISVLSNSGFSDDSRFGKELVPQAGYLNLTYAYDAMWSWGLTTTTSPNISSTELGTKGYVWSAFDTKKNKYLFNWQPFHYHTVFSVGLDSPNDISHILPVQKDVFVVVALPNGTPTYYFDLGKYCSQYPEKVSNLTEENIPACTIKKMPNPQAQCDERAARFEKLLQQGLITCEIAERSYFKGDAYFQPPGRCGEKKFCKP